MPQLLPDAVVHRQCSCRILPMRNTVVDGYCGCCRLLETSHMVDPLAEAQCT